jgi:hypothetical protein
MLHHQTTKNNASPFSKREAKELISRIAVGEKM